MSSATISEEKLAELVALQWRLSSLADDLKHLADHGLAEILSPMAEQFDDGSSTDEQPSPFYAKVQAFG